MIRSLLDDELALIGALRLLSGNTSCFAFNYDGSGSLGGGLTSKAPPNPGNLEIYSGIPTVSYWDYLYFNWQTTWMNGWWSHGGYSYIQSGFIDNTQPYADGYPLPFWGAAWDSGHQCFIPTFATCEMNLGALRRRGGVLSFCVDGDTLYLLHCGAVSSWNGGAPFTDTVRGLQGSAGFYTTHGALVPGPGPFVLENDFSGTGPGWIGALTGIFRHNGGWWAIGSGRWYTGTNAIANPGWPAHALLQATGDPRDYTAWTLCQDVVSPFDLLGVPAGTAWISPMDPSGAWNTETGTYIVANYCTSYFDNRTHIYLLDLGATTLTVSRSFLIDEDRGGSIVDLAGELYTTAHVKDTHHVRLYQLVAGVWALISTSTTGADPLDPTHWISDFCVGSPMYATHGYIHMSEFYDGRDSTLTWNAADNSWTAWYRRDPLYAVGTNNGLGRMWPNDPSAP